MLGEEAFAPEGVPEGGFLPEAYPQLTVAPIPYTSQAADRADPFMTITTSGWMFLEIGNTRLALPDREEWDKLVGMGSGCGTAGSTHPVPPEDQDDHPHSLEQPVERFMVDDIAPTSHPAGGGRRRRRSWHSSS